LQTGIPNWSVLTIIYLTKTMPAYARKSYIVSLLALLVCIVSAVIANNGVEASWRIAQESGSLDKASWEIGIGGFPLVTGKDNFVLVGAAELASDKIPVIGAIPFMLRSSGKKSLDALYVDFQYHEFFNREALEALESKVSGAFSAVELKKRTSSEDKRFFVSYSLAMLNPGVELRLSEPLFLEETVLREKVNAVTKDGVNVSVPVSASYSKKFGMAATARDTQVVGYSISVSVEHASSLKALLKSSQLSKHISQRQKEIREELTWLAYLSALITSSPKEHATLLYVPLTKVDVGDRVIYGPAPKQETGQVQFDLLKWALLFKTGA